MGISVWKGFGNGYLSQVSIISTPGKILHDYYKILDIQAVLNTTNTFIQQRGHAEAGSEPKGAPKFTALTSISDSVAQGAPLVIMLGDQKTVEYKNNLFHRFIPEPCQMVRTPDMPRLEVCRGE